MEQGTKDAEEASFYSASIYSNGDDKYDSGNENMEDSVESDLEINGLEADAEHLSDEQSRNEIGKAGGEDQMGPPLLN